MLAQSLIWSRTLGNDGHLESEPTFLGAVLIGIGFCAALAVIVFLAF